VPPPLILLPPSEGKACGGDGPPWARGTMRLGSLDRHRRIVLDALARLAREHRRDPVPVLSKLLGVKGSALAEAVEADRCVRRSPTMPAIERYTGVLYGALDHRTLPATSRRRLADQVLIASGAFGLVAPTDPIPDYKLKMGASLPGVGKLSTAWRPHVDAALAPLAEDRTVWNLLPNEHAAAWSGSDRVATQISVRFADEVERGGRRQLVAVAHWNKLLKGALVRHVLATQLDEPDGLVAFEHPLGYRYAPELTEVDGRHVAVTLVARR
jgi:cytoplasmic iron level regulating protein YaaA (DUF328/UPF0246 family)